LTTTRGLSGNNRNELNIIKCIGKVGLTTRGPRIPPPDVTGWTQNSKLAAVLLPTATDQQSYTKSWLMQ
jgi:hypothetical protein